MLWEESSLVVAQCAVLRRRRAIVRSNVGDAMAVDGVVGDVSVKVPCRVDEEDTLCILPPRLFDLMRRIFSRAKSG